MARRIHRFLFYPHLYTVTGLSILLTCSIFTEHNSISPNGKAIITKPEHPGSGNRYALLIGINNYKNAHKLNGCVNDIELMHSFLTKRDFQEKNIFMLPNEKATKDSILWYFNHLIKIANHNDIVLIHFSGHGSQVADDKPGEEIDGLDETLLPYDYINSKADARKTSITDDELDGLLSKLTSKTEKVTVILDACHSGGGTKDISLASTYAPSSVRFVPPIDTPLLNQSAAMAYKELSTDISGYGKNAYKYVLITACRSDEVSRESWITNKTYGILTYCLVSELVRHQGSQLWPEIMENVKYQVSALNYMQTPQLNGDHTDSYVFGSKAAVNKNYLLASPAPDHIINVGGGDIMGVSKGSVFKVFPPGTIDFIKTPVVAEIEITETSASSSKARVIKGSIKEPNSKAVESGHGYPNASLKIALPGNWQTGNLQSLKSTILQIDSVKIDNNNPQLLLTPDNKDIVISTPLNDYELTRVNINTPNLDKYLTEKITMWRKWFHVMQISNPSPAVKLTVTLKSVDKNAKGLSNIAAPDYVFKNNDRVELTIKNNSATPVFINILDMQDNGTIEPYSLGAFSNRPSNDPIPPQKEVRVTFPVTVQDGKRQALDIMKIFATTEDISFDFLKQKNQPVPGKKLAQLVDREFSPDKRNVQVKDWLTLEKVLLIKN